MNTEHTTQRAAAEAAFDLWWQRHGLTDPMDDGDRYYIAARSWAGRGYLAAIQAQAAGMMALLEEVRETCWQVGSGDATIRELDLAAIVDRHAAKIAAAESSAIKLATLCASCARANVDCPVYPQQTASCVEHRPAAEQAPRWPQVDMGFGKFAVSSCTCAVTGVPGLLYLQLDEPRPNNSDCSDVFPVGSIAPEDRIASVIHFHSAEALQQTIDELLTIQREHYPVAEAKQQAEPVAPLRDLIMQAANAVFDETTEAARPTEDGFGVVFGHVDIAAIVDRYAPAQKGGAA